MKNKILLVVLLLIVGYTNAQKKPPVKKEKIVRRDSIYAQCFYDTIYGTIEVKLPYDGKIITKGMVVNIETWQMHVWVPRIEPNPKDSIIWDSDNGFGWLDNKQSIGYMWYQGRWKTVTHDFILKPD